MKSRSVLPALLLALILAACDGGSDPCPLESGEPAALPAEIKRVFMVVLENADADAALAQPFMGKLAKEGAYLNQSWAIRRPSQPNYIAMIAGDTLGVDSNSNYDLNARHLGNLLEERGKTWKVYAEGYPGNCNLDAAVGAYARKHVPFLSFEDVQKDPAKCGRIVAESELSKDVAAGTLPDFAMYIPNNFSNGHDTGVEHADRWMSSKFGPMIADPKFMEGTLLIVTYDEAATGTSKNRIYTSLYGAGVQPGSSSEACVSHYGVLRTVETALGLGHLGQKDEKAAPIQGIWK